jgi:hypothetical protein
MNKSNKSSRRSKRNKRKKNNKNKDKFIVRLTGIGEFAPPQLIVPLRWPDLVSIRTNNGAGVFNNRYRSSAYDPDPVLGTGAIPGYNELAAMYAQYRVHAMHLFIEAINGETSSAQRLIVWPSLVSNTGNTLTAAQLEEQGQGPFGKGFILDRAGSGSKVIYDRKITTTQITGEESWRSDPAYASLISTNPASVWYWNIGGSITTGTYTTTGGLQYNLTIVMDVEFFNRIALTT